MDRNNKTNNQRYNHISTKQKYRKKEIKKKKERKKEIKKAKCKKQRKNKEQGPTTQTDRQLRTENQMHNYEQKRYNK